MSIVCISETKWFGDDIYEVDGYTVIYLFLSLVILSSVVRGSLLCWIQLWQPHGGIRGLYGLPLARIVSAHLKLCLSASNKLNVSYHCKCLCPTHRVPIEMKDNFFDDLQVVISSTPPDDLLLVMGDFNVRVGYGGDMDPSWLGVKGKFGVGASAYFLYNE